MRRTAVLLSFLAMLPAAPAPAQTGTTVTSTTVTSSSTSTTVGSTTTTTPPPVTADADPPAAILAGASGEVQAELGSFCWSPPGAMGGRCVDKSAAPTGPTLTVTRGTTLTVRFTTGLPLTQLVVRRNGVEVPVTGADPSRFRADLPPGTYQLGIFARFSAGDASYGFRLRVTAPPTSPPATPTPATELSLTG